VNNDDFVPLPSGKGWACSGGGAVYQGNMTAANPKKDVRRATKGKP